MSKDIQKLSQQFESTRWSIVLEAGHHSSPKAREAFEGLFLIYWYPLYAYVRRRGYGVQDAEDLTQEFFSRLLEGDTLETADRSRGKFRSFLLTSLRNFLVNEYDKRRTQKRGGNRPSIPLDFVAADSRYSNQPTDKMTPERLYEKQWAITLLDHVMAELREEFNRDGKLAQFEALKAFIAGRNVSDSYANSAQALDISESAAMAAASRLRKRYRTLLRAAIAQTLADPSDVDAEVGYLFEVLGS